MTKASVGNRLIRENLRQSRLRWPSTLDRGNTQLLRTYTEQFNFSVSTGDLLLLERGWYVTHTGLVRLARRKKCCGIHVEAVDSMCEPAARRFVLKATVHPSKSSLGFVGYGDADPSNVSPLVHGAEMRIAETRAVNRALRKAYGIGLCSVEEIGPAPTAHEERSNPRKRPPQSSSGNGHYRVRDRLCQLIRQQQLDAELVKSYAVDYCGTSSLKEASRSQVEEFVQHLAECAEREHWRGGSYQADCIAQPKRSGSWAGSCATSSTIPTCSQARKSTRRRCRGCGASSRLATQPSTALPC